MRALIDLVAPMRCVSCREHADAELCADCARRIRLVSDAHPDGAFEGVRRVRSLVVFAEPARALTLVVKRRGARPAADAIGSLLAALARREQLEADAVTSVPGLHTELIASAVARDLGFPVRRLLRRVKAGPRQADVPLAVRHQNVAGRFAAKRAEGRLILVDDVFTTGATTTVCARALLEAGAQQVDVLTWAYTPLYSRGEPHPFRAWGRA